MVQLSTEEVREEAPEPPALLCHPAQWLHGSTESQKALEGGEALGRDKNGQKGGAKPWPMPH